MQAAAREQAGDDAVRQGIARGEVYKRFDDRIAPIKPASAADMATLLAAAKG